MADVKDWMSLLHGLNALSEGFRVDEIKAHVLASIAGAYAAAGEDVEASGCLERAIGMLPAIPTGPKKDHAFESIIGARAKMAVFTSDADLLNDTKRTLRVLTVEESRSRAAAAVAEAAARIAGALGDLALLGEAESALSSFDDPKTRFGIAQEVMRAWIMNGNFDKVRALVSGCEDYARSYEARTGSPALDSLVVTLSECSIASRSPRLLQQARSLLAEIQASKICDRVATMCASARASHSLGDPAGARQLLESAEDFAYRSLVGMQMALALTDVSRTWSFIGERATARRILLEMDQLSGRIGKKVDWIAVRVGIGRAWNDEGDTGKAVDSIEGCVGLLSSIRDESERAGGLEAIADGLAGILELHAMSRTDERPAMEFDEVVAEGGVEVFEVDAMPEIGKPPVELHFKDGPSISVALTTSGDFRCGAVTPLEIEVQNDGNQPVSLLDFTPAGPFDFGDHLLPTAQLNVGDRARIPISARPQCRGEIPISFRISYSDGEGQKRVYEDFGWVASKAAGEAARPPGRSQRIRTFGNIGHCGQ